MSMMKLNICLLLLWNPPSLSLSLFPFDQTSSTQRQLFSWDRCKLPSSTLDRLQPLSLIFLKALTIHCLWHSPVGSLTPFNQINFIFLSMPYDWMSQIERDVTWLRMSIFSQQFYLQLLQELERRLNEFKTLVALNIYVWHSFYNFSL